jgi:EAL domain-containing protein (putative c-di-GMP-specific phosphodiesterase class I)
MPDYITFEMTESAVLTTDPHFLEWLLRLRMKGFGLVIDDYGTGRSNLQLLARIPFSELKIDRSFVDGASKKQAIGTVLRSCLGLARSLDRRSVAVGVETKQDWDFLQGLGCTYAQGYHIAKLMPVEEFPAWQHFFSSLPPPSRVYIHLVYIAGVLLRLYSFRFLFLIAFRCPAVRPIHA